MGYSVVKAVSLARKIVKECGKDSKLHFVKLIKLMYLCERLYYASFKKFITGDNFVSMKYGPVLSCTYDLIRDNPVDTDKSAQNYWGEVKDIDYWGDNFGTQNTNVVMHDKKQSHHLDEHEISVANRIIESYGDIETWDLVEMLHESLLEWQHTTSSIAISKEMLNDILSPMDEKDVERLLAIPTSI